MVELVLPKHRARVRFPPTAQNFVAFDRYVIIKTLEINPQIIGGFYKNMHNVTIYSTPTCHFCHQAKEFFKANNISYTEHDVFKDMEKRKEMVDKSGQLGVPVIVIDDNVNVGFNKPVIAKALGLI